MRPNRIIPIFMTIFLLYSLTGYAAAHKGLVLEITFDKSEYKQSDPIKLNVKLKNTGNKAVYVNKRFYINAETTPRDQREVYLTVIPPSGKKLPFKEPFKAGLPKTDYFVLLNPNEEVGLQREANIKYYFDMQDVGTYKITATYQNVYGAEIGIDAFKGKIKSKQAKFKIIE